MSLWSDADEPHECEACGRLLDGADLCPSCDYPEYEEEDEGWMTHGDCPWDTTDDEAKP